MNSPLITVIVPVYKVEAYLPQCVESILAQDYAQFELLLVDDGSPDGCGALCDGYARRDARVRVIHQKNAGVSAARNAGLDAARGACIAFADSDDWVEPDWLSSLLAPLQEDGGAQVSACGWFREENGVSCDCSAQLSRGVPDGDAAFCDVLSGGMEGFLWNKLFRTELIGKLRLRRDLAICEDLLFVCTLLRACERVRCVQRPLYHYRIRPDSALRQLSGRLESEDKAREAILALAQGSMLREDAAVFSYVQMTWLNVQRARRAADPRGAALRRKVRARAGRALRAKTVPLRARVKLGLKLLFPFLISARYLQ